MPSPKKWPSIWMTCCSAGPTRGVFGPLPEASLERVADVMGKELRWSDEDKKREIDWVKTYYVPIKKDGDVPPKKTVVVD